MIEKGSVRGLSYVKIAVDDRTVIIVDLYSKLSGLDYSLCEKVVEVANGKLCFINYNGCKLVVSVVSKGEDKIAELIGGEVVGDPRTVSPMEAAELCAQAALERLKVNLSIGA